MHPVGRPLAPNRQERRLTERHFIDVVPGHGRRKCVVCAAVRRRAGSFAGQRVRTWCPDCGVGLCIGQCFRRYHTLAAPQIPNGAAA